ncbi:hypothetical protein JYT72_03235 [Crocinitomix catalasitica]|nr:hypothetical protein [Crocinitomix catalasitica]
MPSENKLAVCVVGWENSGKSETWYSLFGRTVRRKPSKSLHQLQVFATVEFVDVYLVNGSPQESGKYIKEMLPKKLPNIILCSIQYVVGGGYKEDMFGTINWLEDNGYSLVVIWLNPGHKDSYPYLDSAGLTERIHSKANNLIGRRDGNQSPDERAEEIRNFIYGWAKPRNLAY